MYYGVINNDENASRFLSVEKEFQTELFPVSIAERYHGVSSVTSL